MGGGGLLIFYVTNVCYVTKVKSAFSYILYRILVHFVPDFPAAKAVPLHRISKRAETTQTTQTTKTTKTTQTTKTNTNHYEPTYLPAAQPKHKGRV